MSLAMTSEERDEFLLAHHTGVMVVTAPDAPMYATPAWYDYEPGGTVGFVLNADALRLETIGRPGAIIGLVVHDDSMPPSYVSVSGPVVVNRGYEPEDAARVWPAMVRALGGEEVALRYVEKGSDAFLRDKEAEATGQRVEFQPERWATCDYAKSGDRWKEIVDPH